MLGTILFFSLLATVQVNMYLAIRREQHNSTTTAIFGTLSSIILSMLLGFSRENPLAQALIIGFILGIGFSLATLALAFYFQRQSSESN